MTQLLTPSHLQQHAASKRKSTRTAAAGADMEAVWKRKASGISFKDDLKFFDAHASRNLTPEKQLTLWKAWLDNDSPPNVVFVDSCNPDDQASVTRMTSDREIFVSYTGGVVHIPPGSVFYSTMTTGPDNAVWIGWRGSYDPPCDMSGRALVSVATKKPVATKKQ